MKRFDPSVGWIPNPGDATATEGGAPTAATDSASPLPHPSSVYHFNRQGARLNVTRVEEGPQVQASTAPAAPVPLPPPAPVSADAPASPVQRMREAAARAPQESLRAPAETAGMVRELFERLDEADASQALLARVAKQLETLESLRVRKGQLERVLADITQEMTQLQSQVRTDLDAARDHEERNLKLRQYRRELLEQLASRLPPAGQP